MIEMFYMIALVVLSVGGGCFISLAENHSHSNCRLVVMWICFPAIITLIACYLFGGKIGF